MCLEDQQPSYMHKTVAELGIGTYKNIAVVSDGYLMVCGTW